MLFRSTGAGGDADVFVILGVNRFCTIGCLGSFCSANLGQNIFSNF